MDSLCEKVVFPEEDGPAIIMNFRSFAEMISSASLPIRSSNRASWVSIICCVFPAAIASFKAPIVSISSIFPQSLDVFNVWNSFSAGTNGATSLVFLSGN